MFKTKKRAWMNGRSKDEKLDDTYLCKAKGKRFKHIDKETSVYV